MSLVISLDPASRTFNKIVDIQSLALLTDSSRDLSKNIPHKRKLAIIENIRDTCLGKIPKFVTVAEVLPFLQTAQFMCPRVICYKLRDAGARSEGNLLND